jgi:Bacterial Ig-like domain (group 2)
MGQTDAAMTKVTGNIKSLCNGGGIVIALVVVGVLLAGATFGIAIYSLSSSGQNNLAAAIILASLSVLLIGLGVFLQALANGTRSTLMLAAFNNQMELDRAANVDVAHLSSFLIQPNTLALTVSAPSRSLSATPRDQDGNVIPDKANLLKPKWESSDPAVATVDQSGLVQRVSNGATTVTASFGMIRSNACIVTCSA